MNKTVVLIHGAWLTPASWIPFKTRYEARGYQVVTPAWPGLDRPVAELKRTTPPEFSRLSVGKIVEHYAGIIRKLPHPPILVGHSFGGLFTQMLLDRGLGRAGVAIDPAAPRGVLVEPTPLVNALPILLTPFGWSRVMKMSFDSFSKNFANGLPEAQRRAHYENLIVPTPGRIYFQAALGIGIGVDWKNPKRAPLLLIAGEKDRTVTPGMVKSAYEKHSKSPVTTAFKSFPGRSHYLCLEPGWEEVADYAINWAEQNARG
jgi:pimeloyl-ACP methyl ester carboxylesterase